MGWGNWHPKTKAVGVAVSLATAVAESALIDKDEDAAEVAGRTRSQHDQIGVAIAVDIAGEHLTALVLARG